MENQEKINLYQVRDFNENFTTLLDFTKQNYAPIVKGIAIVIPLMLVAVYLMMGLQELNTMTDFDQMFLLGSSLKAFLGLFLYGIAAFAVNIYTVCYMVEYTEGEGYLVNSPAVWKRVKKAILPLFLCSILYGLAVGIGFVLCIIPGIILWIYLLFYQFVYVAENSSIGDSFTRSWNLVTNNWFSTFGFMFVLGILMFIISMVFSLPQYLPVLGEAFDISALNNPILTYITSFIYYSGSLLLAPITVIATGVLYFSRRSDYDNIEINDNIDNLGTPPDNNQYYN